MDITNKIKQLATVDIFKLSQESNYKVGNPFSLDYSKACLLIPDAYKKKVKGIPQGTFLLAFYDNDNEGDVEALLLRAIKPTSLPTDDDNVRSMIEYYKDDLKTSDTKDSELDPQTRYQFSFSGLECRILGTFYKDKSGETQFGADVENFYGAHNYSVYKPFGKILEKIVNFRDGEEEPGNPIDVTVGKVRYSSSKRFAEQEDNIPVYINPKDFLGKRTALFGMTRTGKSNTVKKVIQATVEISKLSKNKLTDVSNAQLPQSPIEKNGHPKFPVGQIIFDINGEYANPNMQDGGTAIYEMYSDNVTRYSILEKDGFKVMKTNFYEDIFAGFELLKSVLIEDDTRFTQNFCSVDLELPDDKKDDFSFMTGYRRLIAAYKCCLKAAGFETRNNTIKFAGEATLNELTGINPSDGITLDQAINWFSAVWDAMGDKHEFFATYKSGHEGNDWASDDLKSLLVMLTRKRKAGSERDVDCSGFRVLKKALDMHTASVDKPYYSEILDLLRSGGIVIADLSQGDPNLIKLYSEKICRRIFNDSMERFIRNKNNNFVQMYFEEAHNLFPKKSETNLSDIYNRLAKEGAKLNIGILYATQEVSSVSSNILKNTQNWFIAHLNNEDELKEIKKYYDFGDFAEGLVRFSAKSDKGFVRMKTYSNPFTVPVQIDKFSIE